MNGFTDGELRRRIRRLLDEDVDFDADTGEFLVRIGFLEKGPLTGEDRDKAVWILDQYR